MADTVLSPNMSLPVPVVGVDPGPDWATNINSCLSIVDSHNHTPGQGVPITPSALNINTDLTINDNNLTDVRSVRFSPAGAPLSDPADLGCIYESGVDLYYNDGAGNQIRLTQSGSPAGATGTITGLPSGTASASFSGATFTFQSATNTPAFMNFGPPKIGQPIAGGFGVTLTPNVAQAADYELHLPLALPTANSVLTSDTSGNTAFLNNGVAPQAFLTSNSSGSLVFLFNGANVRGSEGAGTTTLTVADNFWQIFNLSAARTVILPTTGVAAGQRFTMENVTTSALTVQSSGANTIGFVDSLYSKLECIALVNTPTTAAHWMVRLDYSQFPYSHGNNYAGGNPLTISAGVGSISVVTASQFIPYPVLSASAANWRLRGNFQVVLTTNRTDSIFSISNTQWAITGFRQPITLVQRAGTVTTTNSYSEPSDNTIQNVSSASLDTWSHSFDIELSNRPNWIF